MEIHALLSEDTELCFEVPMRNTDPAQASSSSTVDSRNKRLSADRTETVPPETSEVVTVDVDDDTKMRAGSIVAAVVGKLGEVPITSPTSVLERVHVNVEKVTVPVLVSSIPTQEEDFVPEDVPPFEEDSVEVQKQAAVSDFSTSSTQNSVAQGMEAAFPDFGQQPMEVEDEAPPLPSNDEELRTGDEGLRVATEDLDNQLTNQLAVVHEFVEPPLDVGAGYVGQPIDSKEITVESDGSKNGCEEVMTIETKDTISVDAEQVANTIDSVEKVKPVDSVTTFKPDGSKDSCLETTTAKSKDMDSVGTEQMPNAIGSAERAPSEAGGASVIAADVEIGRVFIEPTETDLMLGDTKQVSGQKLRKQTDDCMVAVEEPVGSPKEDEDNTSIGEPGDNPSQRYNDIGVTNKLFEHSLDEEDEVSQCKASKITKAETEQTVSSREVVVVEPVLPEPTASCELELENQPRGMASETILANQVTDGTEVELRDEVTVKPEPPSVVRSRDIAPPRALGSSRGGTKMPKMQPKKLKRHGGAFRVMAGISLAGILFVAALSRQRRPMKLRDDLNMALMELQDHYCAPVAQGDLGLNDSMQGDSVTAMEAPFWAIQSLKALTFDCLCPGRVKTTIRWQKVEPELRAAFWKRRKSQLYNLMINDEEGSVVLERKRVVSARVQKDKIVFTYHEGAEELAVAPWAA